MIAVLATAIQQGDAPAILRCIQSVADIVRYDPDMAASASGIGLRGIESEVEDLQMLVPSHQRELIQYISKIEANLMAYLDDLGRTQPPR